MPKLLNAERQYKDQLVRLFRDSGWEVLSGPNLPVNADLRIKKGKLEYVVEVKRAAESRRDRVVPLLAEAILQAQRYAQALAKARPLAIIVSPRLSPAVVDQAVQFQQAYARDVGIGFVDDRGLRLFHAPGLEQLNSLPEEIENKKPALGEPKSHPLFSDLGQWMLKVILAQHIDPKLLNAPRRKIHNASELASAAEVSQVSASRLIRQLEAEGGFLNTDSDQIELVRVQDLLEEWQAAGRRAYKEIPCRWIIPGHGRKQFDAALRGQHVHPPAKDSRAMSANRNSPRLCLGLFAAAEALGLGFVHGVPPLLVERIDPELIQRLGISKEKASQPDVYLRIPVYKESVFRAAVEQKGLPVSDVLQIWLDVSNHPSRGKEQADRLREQILEPLLSNK